MAFDFSLFPVALQALGVDSVWSTTVTEMGGGNEQRNINWNAIRREYDALTGIITQANFDAVQQHFNARRGQGYSFPLLDRSFFQVTTPALIGTGDGANKDFQLSLPLGDAVRAYSYQVYLPIQTTVAIFDNGGATTEGVTWTVPYTGATAGLVHFATAPVAAHLITATFQYYIPVRYNMDQLNSKLFVWNANIKLFEGPELPLREVRYLSEF